jgi:hypothetical protein
VEIRRLPGALSSQFSGVSELSEENRNEKLRTTRGSEKESERIPESQSKFSETVG